MTTITPSKPRTPALQPGDRLSRAEFERRFDATPGLKRAELIEGVVYMPPPVPFANHGGPHADLITWLGTYRAATAGVLCGDNSSLRLDLDNMPQPDVFLMISAECGGQASIDEDGYVAGAPDLVAEVSASSVSIDLHAKLNVYRRNGVLEYVGWRVLDREIDWFVLREGEYKRLVPTEGVYRSGVLPGLWLDVAAMLAGDLAAVQRVAQQGLATTEHATFVEALQRRRAGRSA